MAKSKLTNVFLILLNDDCVIPKYEANSESGILFASWGNLSRKLIYRALASSASIGLIRFTFSINDFAVIALIMLFQAMIVIDKSFSASAEKTKSLQSVTACTYSEDGI